MATILGSALTFIFGVFGIWAYKRTRKKPSLKFEVEECYSLFRDDVKRLNIEIMYNGEALAPPLILLKAKIVNVGDVDIDKNHIHTPLKLILDVKYHCLEIKSDTNQNNSVSSVSAANSKEIQITWDLLKVKEEITFEALIQIEEGNDTSKVIDNFYESIKFEYRITELNHIQKDEHINESFFQELNRLVKSKMFAFLLIIVGIIGFPNPYLETTFLLRQSLFANYDFVYAISNNDSTCCEAIITPTKKETVDIFFVDSKNKINVTTDEFNENYKIINVRGKRVSQNDILSTKIVSGVFILTGVFLLVLNIIRQRKKANR